MCKVKMLLGELNRGENEFWKRGKESIIRRPHQVDGGTPNKKESEEIKKKKKLP